MKFDRLHYKVMKKKIQTGISMMDFAPKVHAKKTSCSVNKVEKQAGETRVNKKLLTAIIMIAFAISMMNVQGGVATVPDPLSMEDLIIAGVMANYRSSVDGSGGFVDYSERNNRDAVPSWETQRDALFILSAVSDLESLAAVQKNEITTWVFYKRDFHNETVTTTEPAVTPATDVFTRTVVTELTAVSAEEISPPVSINVTVYDWWWGMEHTNDAMKILDTVGSLNDTIKEAAKERAISILDGQGASWGPEGKNYPDTHALAIVPALEGWYDIPGDHYGIIDEAVISSVSNGVVLKEIYSDENVTFTTTGETITNGYYELGSDLNHEQVFPSLADFLGTDTVLTYPSVEVKLAWDVIGMPNGESTATGYELGLCEIYNEGEANETVLWNHDRLRYRLTLEMVDAKGNTVSRETRVLLLPAIDQWEYLLNGEPEIIEQRYTINGLEAGTYTIRGELEQALHVFDYSVNGETTTAYYSDFTTGNYSTTSEDERFDLVLDHENGILTIKTRINQTDDYSAVESYPFTLNKPVEFFIEDGDYYSWYEVIIHGLPVVKQQLAVNMTVTTPAMATGTLECTGIGTDYLGTSLYWSLGDIYNWAESTNYDSYMKNEDNSAARKGVDINGVAMLEKTGLDNYRILVAQFLGINASDMTGETLFRHINAEIDTNIDGSLVFYQYEDLLKTSVLSFNSTDVNEMTGKIEMFIDFMEGVTCEIDTLATVNLQHVIELLYSTENTSTSLFMDDYGLTARVWKIMERLGVFEKFVTLEETETVFNDLMTRSYLDSASEAAFSNRNNEERKLGETKVAVKLLGLKAGHDGTEDSGSLELKTNLKLRGKTLESVAVEKLEQMLNDPYQLLAVAYDKAYSKMDESGVKIPEAMERIIHIEEASRLVEEKDIFWLDEGEDRTEWVLELDTGQHTLEIGVEEIFSLLTLTGLIAGIIYTTTDTGGRYREKITSLLLAGMFVCMMVATPANTAEGLKVSFEELLNVQRYVTMLEDWIYELSGEITGNQPVKYSPETPAMIVLASDSGMTESRINNINGEQAPVEEGTTIADSYLQYKEDIFESRRRILSTDQITSAAPEITGEIKTYPEHVQELSLVEAGEWSFDKLAGINEDYTCQMEVKKGLGALADLLRGFGKSMDDVSYSWVKNVDKYLYGSGVSRGTPNRRTVQAYLQAMFYENVRYMGGGRNNFADYNHAIEMLATKFDVSVVTKGNELYAEMIGNKTVASAVMGQLGYDIATRRITVTIKGSQVAVNGSSIASLAGRGSVTFALDLASNEIISGLSLAARFYPSNNKVLFSAIRNLDPYFDPIRGKVTRMHTLMPDDSLPAVSKTAKEISTYNFGAGIKITIYTKGAPKLTAIQATLIVRQIKAGFYGRDAENLLKGLKSNHINIKQVDLTGSSVRMIEFPTIPYITRLKPISSFADIKNYMLNTIAPVLTADQQADLRLLFGILEPFKEDKVKSAAMGSILRQLLDPATRGSDSTIRTQYWIEAIANVLGRNSTGFTLTANQNSVVRILKRFDWKTFDFTAAPRYNNVLVDVSKQLQADPFLRRMVDLLGKKVQNQKIVFEYDLIPAKSFLQQTFWNRQPGANEIASELHSFMMTNRGRQAEVNLAELIAQMDDGNKLAFRLELLEAIRKKLKTNTTNAYEGVYDAISTIIAKHNYKWNSDDPLAREIVLSLFGTTDLNLMNTVYRAGVKQRILDNTTGTHVTEFKMLEKVVPNRNPLFMTNDYNHTVGQLTTTGMFSANIGTASFAGVRRSFTSSGRWGTATATTTTSILDWNLLDASTLSRTGPGWGGDIKLAYLDAGQVWKDATRAFNLTRSRSLLTGQFPAIRFEDMFKLQDQVLQYFYDNPLVSVEIMRYYSIFRRCSPLTVDLQAAMLFNAADFGFSFTDTERLALLRYADYQEYGYLLEALPGIDDVTLTGYKRPMQGVVSVEAVFPGYLEELNALTYYQGDINASPEDNVFHRLYSGTFYQQYLDGTEAAYKGVELVMGGGAADTQGNTVSVFNLGGYGQTGQMAAITEEGFRELFGNTVDLQATPVMTWTWKSTPSDTITPDEIRDYFMSQSGVNAYNSATWNQAELVITVRNSDGDIKKIGFMATPETDGGEQSHWVNSPDKKLYLDPVTWVDDRYSWDPTGSETIRLTNFNSQFIPETVDLYEIAIETFAADGKSTGGLEAVEFSLGSGQMTRDSSYYSQETSLAQLSFSNDIDGPLAYGQMAVKSVYHYSDELYPAVEFNPETMSYTDDATASDADTDETWEDYFARKALYLAIGVIDGHSSVSGSNNTAEWLITAKQQDIRDQFRYFIGDGNLIIRDSTDTVHGIFSERYEFPDDSEMLNASTYTNYPGINEQITNVHVYYDINQDNLLEHSLWWETANDVIEGLNGINGINAVMADAYDLYDIMTAAEPEGIVLMIGAVPEKLWSYYNVRTDSNDVAGVRDYSAVEHYIKNGGTLISTGEGGALSRVCFQLDTDSDENYENILAGSYQYWSDPAGNNPLASRVYGDALFEDDDSTDTSEETGEIAVPHESREYLMTGGDYSATSNYYSAGLDKTKINNFTSILVKTFGENGDYGDYLLRIESTPDGNLEQNEKCGFFGTYHVAHASGDKGSINWGNYDGVVSDLVSIISGIPVIKEEIFAPGVDWLPSTSGANRGYYIEDNFESGVSDWDGIAQVTINV